jgi:hypothetical protein
MKLSTTLYGIIYYCFTSLSFFLIYSNLVTSTCLKLLKM